MKRAVIIATLLAVGCVQPLLVPATEYCEQLEALGCDVVCNENFVCDKVRADACYELVEAKHPMCEGPLTAFDDEACEDICWDPAQLEEL